MNPITKKRPDLVSKILNEKKELQGQKETYEDHKAKFTEEKKEEKEDDKQPRT